MLIFVAFSNLLQITAGSCFTAAPWDTFRALVADITPATSLAACQDACLMNDQCAAASYSSASTCALLGADSGEAMKCGAAGTLSVRDPNCGAPTTSTTAATTTTMGKNKECGNTCMVQVALESSVDPAMLVDVAQLCMMSCPSGTMGAKSDDGIWFDVPNNLLACQENLASSENYKWCSPTSAFAGYRDPLGSMTLVVQCSGSTVVPPLRANTTNCPIIAGVQNPDCITPAYVDPGCNAALHSCTAATRNGASLECPEGHGLFFTDTHEGISPLVCVEGQWYNQLEVLDQNTAVYCKTCASVVVAPDVYGYNSDGIAPKRSADGLSYECAAPYGMWLAYHPTSTDGGPEPSSMIKDWVGLGVAYDTGCATNAWGECPKPAWTDPKCDRRLHVCLEATVDGASLKCSPGFGLFFTATNQASDPWTCGAGNKWKSGGSAMEPTTAVYCKSCVDPKINVKSYDGDGVLPYRSADFLSYLCPAPYTEVWLTYIPAGATPPAPGWYTRRTTQFVCDAAAGYYWKTPGTDNGPITAASAIESFVSSGAGYDIGCTKGMPGWQQS